MFDPTPKDPLFPLATATIHREGRTLIVVTHDPAVARRADRVLVLRDGTIAKRVAGRDVTDLNRLFDFGDAAP